MRACLAVIATQLPEEGEEEGDVVTNYEGDGLGSVGRSWPLSSLNDNMCPSRRLMCPSRRLSNRAPRGD